MNIEEKLEMIDNKRKKIKLYKVFDLFIRSILTIFGTVSLVSILMLLNGGFGVSYFSCLLITCVVPSVYSFIVNSSLEGFDKKIKNMKYELYEMEQEYKQIIDLIDVKEISKDIVVSKIEFRFDGLSSERKLELLNCLKNNILDAAYSQYIDEFSDKELISLEDNERVIYSRKRKK